MNIDEKRRIILERISIIDEHIGLNQSNIDGGFESKEGQPSFESVIEDFLLKKQSLLRALDDLQ